MNENEPTEPPSSSSSDDDTPGREPSSLGGLSVDLIDRSGGLDAGVFARLSSQVRGVLAQTGASGDVRVEIVGDEAMAAAHAEYLDIEGTTDVLTFDLTGGASATHDADGAAIDSAAPLDVDIMICVDEARRQASELGHPVEHEMTLYALHGVLHALGYDDTSDAAFERMHAEEDRLLTAAGLGALFSGGDA